MLDINKISHTIHHTEEWLNARLGKITASRFGELIGEKSDIGIFSQGAMSYLIDMAGEKVTRKRSRQEFFNDAINWGNANEPEAVIRSCNKVGKEFILKNNDGSTHRLIISDEYSGCTPDALILPFEDVNKCFDVTGNKIKVTPFEVKCPPTYNVFGRFLEARTPIEIKKLEKKYFWQVVFQISSCQSLNGFFGVYHPDFPNDCNVIEFKKIDLIKDFMFAEKTLQFAKIEIDKWVNIFSNKN